MNMWTVILAGFLIVTLGSALEDAGVYVNGTYSQGKFERRVLPPMVIVCATNRTIEWWRFNLLEQVLRNFESRNIVRNATLRLGTPGLHMLEVATVEFKNDQYCRYLPKAYHKDNLTLNGVYGVDLPTPIEYFAVKVKNTQRATVKQGWNYLNNLVKNRFPNISQANLHYMIVETAASGQVYVGAAQTG